MKKIYFIMAIVLVAFSCKQEPAYKINGTVADLAFEGATVYLLHGGWAVNAPQMDSTLISKGKYEFKGIVANPECGRIIVKHPEDWQKSIHIPLAIENADITAATDAEGWSTVKGTTFNDAYQQFLEAKREPERQLFETIDDFYAKQEAGTLTPEEEKQMRKVWGEQREAVYDIEFDFLRRNVNNPAFWNDLRTLAIMTSLERQQALLAAANEKTLEQPIFKEMAALVATLERTAVGVPYTNLHMQDPNGNAVSLSDFVGKGKYILLDFWASWCGPCRREMPNVLKAYNTYKNKGFDVVGISSDDSHDAWVKALKELNLPWHQMSDLKKKKPTGTDIYGISGIPHTVLIDPNGIIIARGLHGKDLHKKLAEIFGE